jgi:hypothetical protein
VTGCHTPAKRAVDAAHHTTPAPLDKHTRVCRGAMTGTAPVASAVHGNTVGACTPKLRYECLLVRNNHPATGVSVQKVYRTPAAPARPPHTATSQPGSGNAGERSHKTSAPLAYDACKTQPTPGSSTVPAHTGAPVLLPAPRPLHDASGCTRALGKCMGNSSQPAAASHDTLYTPPINKPIKQATPAAYGKKGEKVSPSCMGMTVHAEGSRLVLCQAAVTASFINTQG